MKKNTTPQKMKSPAARSVDTFLNSCEDDN
jgi:hypothetical protein